LRGLLRHGRSRLTLEAGRGLDLDVRHVAVGQQLLRDGLERRQALALERRGVPGAGIEGRELLPREIARAPLPAGGALQRRVVQQHRHVILRELHVELVRAEAQGLAELHRGERVLGSERSAAAMGEELRIGPVPHENPKTLTITTMKSAKPMYA